MGTRERSELQLLRISRGAHELAQMIDSWSKTPTRGGESVHIANKLLRGSLELQDSLQILTKLQKDSCRMSDKNMRQRVKEEDAGDQNFKGRFSTRNKIWLQETRVSVDGCSTNSMEVMKQVIRDRLCTQSVLPLKSDDKNVLFNKTSFNSQVKTMKVPCLIAKLMGLEEFPSGILEPDFLERPGTQIGAQRTNFDEDDEVPSVVIMKSMNFSPWSGEEFNLVTKVRSKREKITLAELILRDKSFGHDYFPSNTNKLKRNVKHSTDQIQELDTVISESQQQQEKKVIMESKLVQGKKFVELKEVKTIAAPAGTVFVRSRESDERKITANVNLQTDKSRKQNKAIYSPKSMAVNSNCSLNREKTSREEPARRIKMEAKTDVEKFKDGRLRSSTIATHAVLRGKNISPTNVLPKQGNERIIFVNKGDIGNDSRIIEQDRRISKLIEQSQEIFKSQLLCSQKNDIQCQSKRSAEFEDGGDQLLLDYSKEPMPHKSHEGKFSISQITDVRRRSKTLSLGNFSEEISSSTENLNSSNEIGDDITAKKKLYIILESDLRCNSMISNSSWDNGWNNGFSAEEVEQIVVQMEEQIISRVLMDVATDLVAFV